MMGTVKGSEMWAFDKRCRIFWLHYSNALIKWKNGFINRFISSLLVRLSVGRYDHTDMEGGDQYGD
jgi:hypothetical protein